MDLALTQRAGRDAEGRLRTVVHDSIVLVRCAARLTGRTDGVEQVMPVAHSDARVPGPLQLVDIADASDGVYELRVPSAGDYPAPTPR